MPGKDGSGRLGRGRDCDPVAKSDRMGRGLGQGLGRGRGLGRGLGRRLGVGKEEEIDRKENEGEKNENK